MSDMLPIAPGPQAVDPHALAERRRRRGRRRLAVWGAFLLFGLLLGTIYATGFTTITGSGITGATATPLTADPGATQTALLTPNIVRHETNLAWTWTGRWGSIATADMYELNLTGNDPVDKNEFEASDKFYSEIVLVKPPAGFSDLQIQFRIAKLVNPLTETCAVAGAGKAALESTASANKRVMYFDTADTQVTFSSIDGAAETVGLPGGARYCVGLVHYTTVPEAGKDEAGTFIRKPTASVSDVPTYPEFVVTLNRKS